MTKKPRGLKVSGLEEVPQPFRGHGYNYSILSVVRCAEKNYMRYKAIFLPVPHQLLHLRR